MLRHQSVLVLGICVTLLIALFAGVMAISQFITGRSGGGWFMGAEERRVEQLVSEAFDGVVLGNGVGLREGDGLDDYADEATLAQLRSLDEKLDWRAIPAEDLERYRVSLSFFDAEGMRFHLPAFILAELRGEVSSDLEFHLSYDGEGGMERFALLNAEQKHAVAEFLKRELPAPEFIEPKIKRALAEFWEAQ